MIPEADTLLTVGATRLLSEVAPALPPGYAQGGASTVALVMLLSAQEYAKGADTRIWENARMAELLAASGVADDTRAASNTIADLNAANAVLRRKLIALHERLENEQGAEARSAEKDILAFLKESGDRRRLFLPVM